MKLIPFILAVFATVSAGPVIAQSLGEATPRDLQDQATFAVNQGDADQLLEVMQEMQRRHMLFFENIDLQNCEREPDKIGILASKPFAWVGARQAYFTHLRQRRMEAGDCGCITGQMTFDEFAVEFVGAPAAEMNEDQYEQLNAFQRENGSTTEQSYRDYRNTYCEAD